MSVPSLPLPDSPFPGIPSLCQGVVDLTRSSLAELAVTGSFHPAGSPIHKTAARQREYLASRRLAEQVLRRQGCGGQVSGEGATTSWPAGFVGSISHSPTLAAVLVSPTTVHIAVGIDTEMLVDNASQEYIVRYCLRDSEWRQSLAQAALGERELASLLFSAKEAWFKCLYPCIRSRFDFTDVETLAIKPEEGGIALRLVRKLSESFPAGYAAHGRYRFVSGHVFTVFTLPAP